MHLKGNIKVQLGQATHTGPKDRNEDALGARIPTGSQLATKGITAVIADGVSAASAAKEASESAVLNFLTDYYETPEPWEVKTAGHRVLSALNRWLFSQSLGHQSFEKGAVCTFTGLILKSHTGHLFHIGDSRLYRLRTGLLEQLSTDHSSLVSEKTAYLTRALGLVFNPQIDYCSFELQPGDTFLLTTDGIHDELTPAQIQQTLEQHPPPEAVDQLSHLARDAQDNRSCLVLRIDSLPDSDKDEVFRRLTHLPFPPELSPGDTLDGYRVDRILAATKTTQLYLVTDPKTKRRLVMKTPSVSFSDDPPYLERFALEEWIGLRTRHQNIVKVVTPARPRTRSYYLLEYVEGITLTKWIETNPAADLHEIVALVTQIISGTRSLHRRDTLHQDLKPDNILVCPGLLVKIIDFGSCHIGGITEITSPFERQSALGTIDFSAPEYRYGARPSTKSDLFSIAAITYFLVTRQHHPFGEPWEKAQSLRDFTTLTYISATRHNPMVPLWFDAALKKALSPTPVGRQESMSEFLGNLKKPDYTLLGKEALPFLEKDPVRFWKTLSALLAIALIIALIL